MNELRLYQIELFKKQCFLSKNTTQFQNYEKNQKIKEYQKECYNKSNFIKKLIKASKESN